MSDNTGRNYREKAIKIDINVLVRDLLKDLWLIVIFGLSVAMCSYIIYSLLYKPAYKSSATFAVTTKGSNMVYTNLAAANMVAETLTRVFSSTVLENKVTKDLQLDEIPGKIEAQLIDETNLFVLTVTANSPHLAYQIIKSIMKNYTNVTDNIFGNAILNLLEAPKLPVYPDNSPNYHRIMIISCLLGMAAMSGLLAYLSINRDNIKNEDELVEKLNTRLLGVIYHEKKGRAFRPFSKKTKSLLRKKNDLIISSATVSFSFVEAIKKIRARYEYKASQKGSNVLLVTSVLAGEGKSTIATNLAISLVKKGYNVLLVDADFLKPSVYKILQREVELGQEIGECILSSKDIKEALIFDENSGLYLLLGSRLMSNSLDLILKDSFHKLISASKKIMDYVIIDAPPITVSAHTELLADIADSTILVVRQNMAPTRAIQDAIDILSDSSSEFLGCVLNNVHMPIFGKNGRLLHKSYKYYYGYYDRKEAVNN